MLINTKFDIGDTVWFLDYDARPLDGIVTKVMWNSSPALTEEDYCVLHPAGADPDRQRTSVFNASRLGRSKEDLREILNSYFI